MNLFKMRTDFLAPGLKRSHMAPHPLDQFLFWFQDAITQYEDEANAMTLATASETGQPSARMVLLKDCTESGFSFFTNYESPKGQQLIANPQAALLFYWPSLHRQVRIEGRAEKISAEKSEAYFQGRPWESQVGSWSSPQSQVIGSRKELLGKVALNAGRFIRKAKLPLPPFWGGFLVVPNSYEFWQGQPSRLHDRFRYQLLANGEWKIERLAP